MALRLRYGDKSLMLSSGQVFVGRSADCQVVVQDPLASRRHAAITMSKAGAFVSDLGSRAGVVVNGETVLGARKLSRGDTIQIASLRLVVEELHLDADDDEPTDPRLRSTMTPPSGGATTGTFRLAPTPAFGIPRVARQMRDTIADTADADDDGGPDLLMRTQEAPRVTVPNDLLPRDLQAPAPREREAPGPGARDLPPSGPRDLPPSGPRDLPPSGPRDTASARIPGSEAALRAVAVLAEKALALGRADEAERILQRTLTETLDAARRNEADAATLELAASLAARLATATAAGRWFDAIVVVYRARAEMLPAPVIDLLFAALHKVKGIDKAGFREYVGAMRSAPGDSPARRFLIQRLEGLRRLADLK